MGQVEREYETREGETMEEKLEEKPHRAQFGELSSSEYGLFNPCVTMCFGCVKSQSRQPATTAVQ